MKISHHALAAWLLAGAFVHADTITLIDPSGIVVSPSGHSNAYEFPLELLEPTNSTVSLNINFDSTNPNGFHEIVSTHPLFDPNDVVSTICASSELVPLRRDH